MTMIGTNIDVEPMTPEVALPVMGTKLVGESAAITSIKEIAGSVASRRSTVMVLGETGSGKEMLARYIHEHSDRHAAPFVPVDCSSLSDGLFESELFGHVKGAFTGATRDSLGFIRAADQGTLFLDEIGELSLHLQAKLLRVLQERCVTPVGESRPKPVDIRVITATNRNLHEMVARSQFRQDLFFRLNVMVLQLPPLRERVEDIIPLAKYLLNIQAEIYNEQIKELSPEVNQVLKRYPWPGNVRELANVMEHAHALATGNVIKVTDIPPRIWNGAQGEQSSTSELCLAEVERRTIAEALKRTNYRKAAASRMLGVNIQRLNRMISRLRIEIPKGDATTAAA